MPETRDAKLAVVRTDLDNLRTYVKSVAALASPSDADAIIESAGMTTRKVAAHDEPALAAKQGSVSGSVKLTAKAAAKQATYTWEYSTDQKTCDHAPADDGGQDGGLGADEPDGVLLPGPGDDRQGLGEWGQVVSLLVK